MHRLAATCVCLLIPLLAHAQAPAVHQVFALEPALGEGTSRLEVAFDREFGTAAAVASATLGSNYRVIDVGVTPAVELLISSVTVRTLGSTGRAMHSSLVILDVAARLQATPKGRYVLIVSGVQFAGGTVTGWSGPVPFGAASAPPSAALRRIVDKADDRDASDIYLAGEAGRSTGKDFFGALDVKLQYPLGYKEIGGRIHSLAPAFDLRASSDPDGDPDSLNLGILWGFNPMVNAGPLLALRWENQGGLESAKDFDVTNALWSSKVRLLSHTWQPSSFVLLYARPYVGLEVGDNLSSPADGPKPGNVVRTSVGSTATLSINVLNGIGLEANYERRTLHEDEFINGSALAAGNREWLEGKLTFNVTKFWGVFIGFEDGRKPPVFKEVKDRLRFGFSYKARVALK